MIGLDLAEITITSSAELLEGQSPSSVFTIEDVEGIGVLPQIAEGKKCIRCFKVLPEVGSIVGHTEVCNRCADAADNFISVGNATS
jgi:isoleucyl-tRNA synthetase